MNPVAGGASAIAADPPGWPAIPTTEESHRPPPDSHFRGVTKGREFPGALERAAVDSAGLNAASAERDAATSSSRTAKREVDAVRKAIFIAKES
mmetsp:Transcript_22585/g.66844  ORF Transcript_22585/g.66844 Transcript_22585/m.66844 type:complete len:94 (-) Transcript_22585:2053-2334(-)